MSKVCILLFLITCIFVGYLTRAQTMPLNGVMVCE